MKNQQVAHLWASRNRESAKGSNFYFEGSTIYSYGQHFPIARWEGDVVLLTTRSYSSSTQRHTSYVRRAIPSSVDVFNVHDVTCENPAIRLDEYMARVRDAFIDAKSGRPSSRAGQWRHETAVRLLNEFKRYCEVFKLDYPFAGTDVEAMAESAKAKLAEMEEQRKAEEARRNAAKIAEAKEKLVAFIAGDRSQTPYAGFHLLPPVLRSIMRPASKFDHNNPTKMVEVVQTSHGAEVEYDHAQRSFAFIKAVWDRGEEWHRNGKTHHVGAFSLQSITADKVVIGCHAFERAEIERFAAQEGWM